MKAIQKRRAMTGQSGFTLIELLIVIAILGILAAVVVFAVGNVTDNAHDKACEIELRTIKTAMEAYKADEANGEYPASFSDMVGGGNDAFLEEEPDSGRWTYTGGGPAGLTGHGPCAEDPEP